MARTARKTAPVRTLAARIRELRTEAKALYDCVESMTRGEREVQTARWEALGGCTRCRGRGWVVVWDTLDSLSGCYAEYGPCPNEACTARTLGPSPGGNHSKYDQNRGTKDTFVPSPELLALKAELQSLNSAIEQTESEARVARNKVVTVVKGRKVPVGTTGTCFWIGGTRFGDRVGLKEADGTVHWTSVDNVEVVAAR